jgi:putative glutamine amidotransferase
MANAPCPLVGISACVKEINQRPFHAVHQRYLHALTDVAGCTPMIIPALGDKHDFADLVGRLDGLLLTGSPSNVEPHHYGEARAADDILHDAARDATTLPLIREAIRRDVPVFAVCRGIQELNVALGGSLHQFVHAVPGRFDHRSDRNLPPEERYLPCHKARLTPGGYLARLANSDEIEVNSLHGQCIDRLGDGLAIEAVAFDGTIEAVRVVAARSFALGVQWHPEAIHDCCSVSRALFEAFGNSARDRARRRMASTAAA